MYKYMDYLRLRSMSAYEDKVLAFPLHTKILIVMEVFEFSGLGCLGEDLPE